MMFLQALRRSEHGVENLTHDLGRLFMLRLDVLFEVRLTAQQSRTDGVFKLSRIFMHHFYVQVERALALQLLRAHLTYNLGCMRSLLVIVAEPHRPIDLGTVKCPALELLGTLHILTMCVQRATRVKRVAAPIVLALEQLRTHAPHGDGGRGYSNHRERRPMLVSFIYFIC